MRPSTIEEVFCDDPIRLIETEIANSIFLQTYERNYEYAN